MLKLTHRIGERLLIGDDLCPIAVTYGEMFPAQVLDL